ncbi:hypothetical protein KAI04_05205 [Candidatus Pacearchaeota archaeon]|nr:hypothetical protein [Candidatus Pacearchaeota archaeon]
MDSVDLVECKKRNIIVKNTPSALTNAVAEMVIGQMINLARRIQESDKKIRKGDWERYIGKEIKDCVVGKIGSSVFRKLKAFNPKEILVNDLVKEKAKNYLM